MEVRGAQRGQQSPKEDEQRSLRDSEVRWRVPTMGALLDSPRDFLPCLDEVPDALKTLDSGQARLQELGYEQELQRHFGILGSICAGVSTMGFMLSITGGLPMALPYGGPVAIVWGWVIISMFQMCIGLALAELASSFPLAGGPYFWCVELTGNNPRSILVAWLTGWLNILGQFASTAGAAFLTAVHLTQMLGFASGHQLTKEDSFLVYAVVLVAAGLLASLPTRRMRSFSVFAAFFMMLGGIALFIVLPACAPMLRPASFVFTRFTRENEKAFGIPNDAYLFMLGTLNAAYAYIGMESPAQFSEETKRADRAVPWGIVGSIGLNFIFGLAYILVLLFCLPADYMIEGRSFSIPEVFFDIFNDRFGLGHIGTALSLVPCIAMLNTTVMFMVTSSRMLWSYARDGGVPLYKVWARVSPVTGTPINAVWAITALAFIVGFPALWAPQALVALGSMATLGLYLSYAAPIVLRILYRKDFQPGPFSLAAFSTPLLLSALAAIVLILACCVLPPQLPVMTSNMNWAPIAAGIVILGALIGWFLPVIGASSWYRGKVHTLRDPEMRGGERYLERDSKQASIPLLEMLDLHIQQHKKSMDAAKPTGGLKGPTEAASDGTSPYQDADCKPSKSHRKLGDLVHFSNIRKSLHVPNKRRADGLEHTIDSLKQDLTAASSKAETLEARVNPPMLPIRPSRRQ